LNARTNVHTNIKVINELIRKAKKLNKQEKEFTQTREEISKKLQAQLFEELLEAECKHIDKQVDTVVVGVLLL